MNLNEKRLEVRWADCDANRHVRHSAYYDYGAHSRIRFFSEIGFDSDTMTKQNIGPILFKEECTFLKELREGDSITVRLLKGDIVSDGSRWVLHHEIYNEKQEKCAHISIKGAWMDLVKRKLTTPPADLVKALHDLPVGDYFVYKRDKG